MRFSRHCRNEMRLYRVSRGDAERIAAESTEAGKDEKGNRKLTGEDERGEVIVVVASDDPDFMITLWRP